MLTLQQGQRGQMKPGRAPLAQRKCCSTACWLNTVPLSGLREGLRWGPLQPSTLMVKETYGNISSPPPSLEKCSPPTCPKLGAIAYSHGAQNVRLAAGYAYVLIAQQSATSLEFLTCLAMSPCLAEGSLACPPNLTCCDGQRPWCKTSKHCHPHANSRPAHPFAYKLIHWRAHAADTSSTQLCSARCTRASTNPRWAAPAPHLAQLGHELGVGPHERSQELRRQPIAQDALHK
jgi:hypothetical protein